MRDTDRLLPLYTFLANIHKENFPDIRIGQFLKNVSDWYGADIFFIEDERLYEIVPAYVKAMHVHTKYVNGK